MIVKLAIQKNSSRSTDDQRKKKLLLENTVYQCIQKTAYFLLLFFNFEKTRTVLYKLYVLKKVINA